MFCPECGQDHHAGERAERAAEDREIALAKINADRDIQVARINARIERDGLETAEEIAEIQADAEVDAAVAEAEIIGAALEASDIPEAEPIEVLVPDVVQDVDVDQTEELPPTEGSPVPDEPRRHGLGMW
jgi:DNA repair exonuclease SbcCD ATPase subunit